MGGGGEQGGSRVIVVCESTLTHACMPPPPRKITIITILSFKISGGGGEFQAPPLYETLVSIAFKNKISAGNQAIFV